MSIEAVVGYWKQVGACEGEAPDEVVARAREAGYVFDSTEFARACEVRDVLRHVYEDRGLRAELSNATAPMTSLLEIARRQGHALSRDDVLPLVRELQDGSRELTAGELDQVAGGARSFLPQTDDEVLVAFASGDMASPVIIGSMWNGTDKPPA